MVYEYKIPSLFSVDAQTAGEELQRIYNEKSRLNASDVVEESRPESSKLHNCFEWRDDVATEMYRKRQAESLIQNVVIKVEHTGQDIREESPKKVTVRAFHNAEQTYRPIDVIMNNDSMKEELKKNALKELISFKKKYKNLLIVEAKFSKVFYAIDELENIIK